MRVIVARLSTFALYCLLQQSSYLSIDGYASLRDAQCVVKSLHALSASASDPALGHNRPTLLRTAHFLLQQRRTSSI